MKYRLHLSRTHLGRREDDGTNYHVKYHQGDDCITWQLLDNSVTEKFIKSFNMIRSVEPSQGNHVSPSSWIAWNKYHTGDSGDPLEEYQRQINRLNQEVQYAIDNKHCDFDNTFLIKPTPLILHMDGTKELIYIQDCCNRIHFEFESKLNDYELQLANTGAPDDKNDFRSCLEKLNRLVHIVEKGPNFNAWEKHFYVIRYNSDHVSANFPKLNNADYELFQQNVENGDLFSDFFTVGKDLGHAYYTRDTNLVHNKEVKQQSVVSGSVHFGFNREAFGVQDKHLWDHTTEYHRWCDHVKADEYGYRYWNPKYNLGRAKIGELIGETLHSITEKFNNTPYLSKVELIED
tara:strand:- start:522 stop:1562 length:1041 start_codon:yes stop_codon:yes gene_type:complete